MADCIIKPSFLRGFDFKLLYSTEGDETYRVMSHDPLGGELLCLPWGHQNILRSTDWGYTFERIENVLTINVTTQSNVVFDARYGLGVHVFWTNNNKTMLAFAENQSNNDAANRAQIHRLPSLSNGPTTMYSNFAMNQSNATTGQPMGVGYANGIFLAGIQTDAAAYQGRAIALLQLNGTAATGYSTGTGGQPYAMPRWSLTRGAYIYGATAHDQTNTLAFTGRYAGIRRRYLPVSAYNLPAPEFVDYFIDAETKVELTDLKDYSGVQPDGAVAIERNGRMWHCTGTGLTGWVRGDDPPTFSIDTNFPHIAAGQGRFGEPVLLSLDISGSYGLLSVDHGQTSQLFELPGEVGLTLPGGVGIVPGADDARFPRAYDLKYISDPATNHTRGRWILCGGQAVWELVPRYGE